VGSQYPKTGGLAPIEVARIKAPRRVGRGEGSVEGLCSLPQKLFGFFAIEMVHFGGIWVI
jgi:hypothetical protein